jgi:carboxypeptidase Taq
MRGNSVKYNEIVMKAAPPIPELSSELLELRTRLAEVSDLRSAAALLHWDQATYMPPGGSEARGRQIATLSHLAHQKMVDERVGELLETLRPLEASTPFESEIASLLRVTRREYEQAARVPPEFEARLSDHVARVYQAWTTARPDNDFSAVAPLLEKTLDFSRELAEYFPLAQGGHIADALINFSDEGMTVGVLRPLFASLRQELVPLVEAIAEQPKIDDSCLHQYFAADAQVAFANTVAGCIGYDWKRGRCDRTHHPFMTKFSLGDVRITNRVVENDASDCLFGTIHETGHALYEQGIDRDYESTPLGVGTSSGVHESQSRLWENLVGRSRPFWQAFYPDLQRAFPQQLESIEREDFYRAINKVERTLIRTEADEVTYNLHVMIRFELELQLLEGKLAIRDLPEAWRESYREYLGLAPQDDASGVLQDVHWYGGTIGGAFQGYTLGNILASQFFECAQKAHTEIEGEISKGQFDTLLYWLRENIYRHGAKFTAPELLERVTGESISIAPYITYLSKKYGELYAL